VQFRPAVALAVVVLGLLAWCLFAWPGSLSAWLRAHGARLRAHGTGADRPPPATDTARPTAPGNTDATSALPRTAGDAPTAAATRVESVGLRRGDTLLRALARRGIAHGLGVTITKALRDHGANLRRVRPTHKLEVTWNLNGEPIAVHYLPSPWLGYVAIASDNGWEVRRSERRPDVRVEAVSGAIERSLFQAVEDAGESAQLATDLVEIFSSDFDFTGNTQPGDRFRLLVEKRYAGDTFVDYGRILVAQYVSDASALTGVGFERAGVGFAHYDPSGRSLRKTFLRSPLEFTRITSGFTYARPHPILGGIQPHLAIDYAAPTGTPVRAVADGAVEAAGWNGGSGISVRLRHRDGFETMYNHLSRLGPGIRSGVHVVQRQVIGFVGATGLATGPHLDFRVARDGRFVNPLRERFLPGEPIPAEERADFLLQARELVARLEDAVPF
jgi:murein DD-endopeptidase MepM/ murein hydrolase activator NlpD